MTNAGLNLDLARVLLPLGGSAVALLGALLIRYIRALRLRLAVQSAKLADAERRVEAALDSTAEAFVLFDAEEGMAWTMSRLTQTCTKGLAMKRRTRSTGPTLLTTILLP